MKHFTAVSICCSALATLSVPAQAQAGPAPVVTGPYVGAGFGAAFGNRETDDADSRNDEPIGHAFKIYGGYQLTETFGVQAGYVRLSDINQTSGAGAARITQSITGRSAYVAGTARLPLGASFALTGKAGVSFGNVSRASPSSAATDLLLGRRTSLLVGTGIEYRLNPHVSFLVELESYGKLSSRVKGNTLTLGSRFMF